MKRAHLHRDRVLLAGLLAGLLPGCASQPGLPRLQTTAFRVLDSSDLLLELVNAGDPANRPGRTAGEGAREGLTECADEFGVFGVLLSPFCAAFGAAVGAATGAVATGVQTLPDEDASRLQQATAAVFRGEDWKEILSDSVRQSAPAHEVKLVEGESDTRVNVYIDDLRWRISVGNQTAIVCTAWIIVEHAGDATTSGYEIRSEARRTENWIADNGQPIAVALEQVFIDLGERVWADLGT